MAKLQLSTLDIVTAPTPVKALLLVVVLVKVMSLKVIHQIQGMKMKVTLVKVSNAVCGALSGILSTFDIYSICPTSTS